MADTATTSNVEVASGTIIAMQMHKNGSDQYAPIVHVEPSDLGGLSVYSLVCAASDNATAVKTTPGVLYGYSVYSLDTTGVYLKLYDLAVAPTVGTSTIKLRFGIPALSATAGASKSEFWQPGITFSTGIAMAVITGITDAGTGNLTASEVLVNLYYK